MTRLSSIILVAALTVAHGIEEQADACDMHDETSLFQASVAYHKRHKTSMDQVLADLEEVALAKGPVVLQELLHVVMALPALKTEKAMRAAVRAEPQLQDLAERYPHLLRAMAMFEDPQKIEQIKTAVYQGHPSLMKMLGKGRQGHLPSVVAPARRMPGDVGLLAFSQDQSDMIVWMEGYGCSTKVSFMGFPEGKLPIQEVSVFGPDCAGSPNIAQMSVDPGAESIYFVMGNYSQTLGYRYTINSLNEFGGKELGSLGDSYPNGVFNLAADCDPGAFFFIQQNGSYPNYVYALMSASLPEVQITTVLSNITGCKYPSSLRFVGTKDMIWVCSKDYGIVNDTNTIMKYSLGAEAPEVLTQQQEYYSSLTATESHIYWMQWENNADGSGSTNFLYSCPMVACIPEKVGELPQNVYNFMIAESGELISHAWDASWEKSTSSTKLYWSTYNWTSTDISGNGTSKFLTTTSGYPNHAQIIVHKSGPPPPPVQAT